ncbi:MAG TPA: hypothetical protein VMV44_10655, partial [Rectinemataceae bacterium]|nr:hypothetical protein [Rectinemataceae bacterium]
MRQTARPFRSLALMVLSTLAAMLLASSCGLADSSLVRVWTDVPEVALYAELFNQEQNRWRVEVVWKADLPREIMDAKDPPDLAIGARLHASVVRERFKPLNYLFGELALDRTAFYPALLAFGET